jgi:sulfate permease, SulP family
MLVLARIFRLVFLADFLSRSALVGFLTGVGVQVAVGELSGLIGLEKHGHGPVLQLVSVFQRLADANYRTAALSLAVLVVIVGCKRIAPRAPGALIAVVGSIVASAAFDFARHASHPTCWPPRALLSTGSRRTCSMRMQGGSRKKFSGS